MPPRLHEPPSQGLDAGPHQPPPSSWQAARPVIDDGLPQSVRFRCLAPHFPSWAIPESTETYTFICPTPCQATRRPRPEPVGPGLGQHASRLGRASEKSPLERRLRWHFQIRGHRSCGPHLEGSARGLSRCGWSAGARVGVVPVCKSAGASPPTPSGALPGRRWFVAGRLAPLRGELGADHGPDEPHVPRYTLSN